MDIKKKIIELSDRGKLNSDTVNKLKYIRDEARLIFDPYPYRSCYKKHKAIFIHIPKTAGTSILKSMGGVAGDHCTYREFQQASPTRFERYFKFCCVRNPYDRVVSSYEYLKQGGNQSTDLARQKLIVSKYDSFDKFVNEFLDADNIYRLNLLKPQYLYIYDEHGVRQVDFIGRFENIDEDFETIKKELGLSESLTQVNRSTRKNGNFMSYYTDELKAKVHSLYRLDFKLLKYEV